MFVSIVKGVKKVVDNYINAPKYKFPCILFLHHIRTKVLQKVDIIISVNKDNNDTCFDVVIKKVSIIKNEE